MHPTTFLCTFAAEYNRRRMKESFRHIYILLLSLVSICAHADDQYTFTVINAANGLADNSAQVIVCTKTGRMIISTIGNLNFYNGTSFSSISTKLEYQYQLPLYRGNYHLYFDKNHHIWLKNTNCMTCVDLRAEQFVENVDSVLRHFNCPSPTLDFFTDSENYFWALGENGLYGEQLQKTYNVLRDRNLQDVDVMDGILYTFYDNGEEVGQNMETGNTLHRTKAYDWDTAQRYTRSSVLLKYGKGFFQIRNGSKEGILLFFDTETKTWETVYQADYHLNNMALRGDVLFIASEWGYLTYDIKTKRTEWIKDLKLLNGETIQTDCNTLAFDRQGGLWIGTERRGLLYARPNSLPFKALRWTDPKALEYAEMMDGMEQNITEFQGLHANCMFTDSRGWSWIGTTSGLYMYKDPHQEPVIFNKSKGFYNDVIHSVVEDRDHNIWVATSDGISFILFEGNKVKFVNSFNRNDNVPSESFYNCKAILLPDGQIAMQAIDHVIVFNPDELKDINTPRTYKLFPKLVKIMVNGYEVNYNEEVNGNVIMDRAVSRVEDINLNSDQNTVVLTFSSLNYYRPLQSYYHVRVKGLGNEDWHTYSFFNSQIVDRQGKLHLPLVSLEPGDYEINVQASMFPDIWEGTPFNWYIHVKQSWWRSRGVFVLFGLVLLALAIVNFMLYVRNTRMRVRRNHEEGNIISKICMFVERCDSLNSEKLSPVVDDYGIINNQNQLSPEFISLMERIIPFVKESRREDLTMRKLGEVADVDIVKLYETVSENIHKSPRDMARLFRLEKAADMLVSTDMTLEEISNECGFYTPNYFIGNFFHKYKQTPREYREEKRGL